jgi:hypothetical protein
MKITKKQIEEDTTVTHRGANAYQYEYKSNFPIEVKDENVNISGDSIYESVINNWTNKTIGHARNKKQFIDVVSKFINS